MHPLIWAYKWFKYQAYFTYQPRQGPKQNLRAEESVCQLVWMDKKYRKTDKKVVSITNCIPAIPTSLHLQCHQKNIRDENQNYTRRLISSPPIVKAYNYRMGGVDRHDRLVCQDAIQLTSKRGYIKIFFRILDSAVVNAWIIFKTVKQARGEWNSAVQRKHTLSWFKENVIMSLCGNYTCRRYHSAVQVPIPPRNCQSLRIISRHQIYDHSHRYQSSTQVRRLGQDVLFVISNGVPLV